MRDGTRVIRAGLPDFVQGEPFLSGPTFANTYHLAGDPSSSTYSYGRYHNPTWTLFEKALGELEGGTALVFASGMAAVTAIFGTMLHPTAERRARWGGDAIADGFIRLSVGMKTCRIYLMISRKHWSLLPLQTHITLEFHLVNLR